MIMVVMTRLLTSTQRHQLGRRGISQWIGSMARRRRLTISFTIQLLSLSNTHHHHIIVSHLSLSMIVSTMYQISCIILAYIPGSEREPLRIDRLSVKNLGA